MADFTFSEQLASGLRSAMLAGRYNLLIGSGVSSDSTGADGEALLSAEELRMRIIRSKSLKQTSTLSRACKQLDVSEVKKYITDPYSGCIPGETLRKLTDFFWRRIYTLNVDDALEAAYRDSITKKQSMVSINYKGDYIHPENHSVVQAVHLHGWVRVPEDGYIFSISEYVGAMNVGNAWTNVLAQTLSSDPFIIAGTSLEEPDLEYFLKGRTEGSHRRERGPSFLIEPYPDAATEVDCERHGLVLIKATLGEFLSYIDLIVPSRPAPIGFNGSARFDLFDDSPSRVDIARFSKWFHLIEPIQMGEDIDLGYYVGEDPTIEDIVQNRDISRSVTGSIKEKLLRYVGMGRREFDFFAIEGNAGTGKTTVLLRIAYELASQGEVVFLFRSTSSMDVDVCAKVLRGIKRRCIIVCDNFADHVSGIVELYRQTVGVDIFYFCAERSYRIDYIRLALGGVPFKLQSIGGLPRPEAASLIAKIESHGLVGESIKSRSRDALSDELARDGIAIAVCRILNDFRPIERIVDSLVCDAREVQKERYVACALATHCYRVGINYNILSSYFDNSGMEAQFEHASILPLNYSDDAKEYVSILNPHLGHRILFNLAENDVDLVFEVYCRVGSAIAPYVNRKTVIQRTPEARLAGRLFDYDEVCRPILQGKSEDFYKRMKKYWDWNSRYWEQVALLKNDLFSRSGDVKYLSQAIAHARFAVRTEEHPFTLTTLGKMLLEEMKSISDRRDRSFSEAFDVLSKAIKLEIGMNRIAVHPYATIFKGIYLFMESGGILSFRQKERARELLKNACVYFPDDRELAVNMANIRLRV